MDEDEIFIQFVMMKCQEKPSLLPRVIDAATMGVKAFAQKQKDFGSKLGFAMTAVIDSTKQEKFGPFTRNELVELTKPWLEGTTWWKENNPDDNPIT